MKSPPMSSRKRSLGGCGWAIVVTLLTCLAVGLTLVLFWRLSAPASATPVDAEVAVNMLVLEVENRNPVAWDDARVTINGRFSRSLGTVGAQQVNRIPLVAFIDEAGNRFEPQRLAVVDVSIAVRFPDGHSRARYEIRR